MIEPRLKYVSCNGAAAAKIASEGESSTSADTARTSHQMAYWEWNATGDPVHPHVLVCVHGLSRQSRDFDTLARALSPHMRVICPDVVGRGDSDWMADPQAYQVPQYAADMVALLQHVHAHTPIDTLDWVGTSMGGLIGMVASSLPAGVLPVAVGKLVLNDVGPVIEWSALERIGQYLGVPAVFASEEQAAAALWESSSSFGPHTHEEWLELSRPMLRATAESSFRLHYDPAIAQPFHALTQDKAQEGERVLWQMYDAISADTLLLRGAKSDLLSLATAQAMTKRGPCARLVQFEGVGHAPTLMAPNQVQTIVDFILGAEGMSV